MQPIPSARRGGFVFRLVPIREPKPTVREVKYIYLLFNIGENQWGVDDVVQKARRFAMGEFAVNAGGLGEDYVANIRKELDAEISQAIRNENNVTRRTR